MSKKDLASARKEAEEEDVGKMLPSWAHCSKEVDARCRRAVQVKNLREELDRKVINCIKCYVSSLPLGPDFDHVRESLLSLLCESMSLAKHPDAPLAEGAFSDIYGAIDAVLRGVIDKSNDVGTVQSAMEHCIAVTNLQDILAEVRRRHISLRAELEQVERHGWWTHSNRRIAREQDFHDAPYHSLGGFGGTTSPCASPAPRQHSTRSQSPTGGDIAPFARSLRGPRRLGGSASSGCIDNRRSSLSGSEIDCGFRRDGGGEETLENWSLFKVQKSRQSSETEATSFVTSERMQRADCQASTLRSHGRMFSDHVQSLRDSASLPALQTEKCVQSAPKLPQLVTSTRPVPGMKAMNVGKNHWHQRISSLGMCG
jgi:hypothetical protein